MSRVGGASAFDQLLLPSTQTCLLWPLPNTAACLDLLKKLSSVQFRLAETHDSELPRVLYWFFTVIRPQSGLVNLCYS
jgi:hypothetical protein